MYLSKVTAGALDDRDYVVNPSAVSGLKMIGEAVALYSAYDARRAFPLKIGCDHNFVTVSKLSTKRGITGNCSPWQLTAPRFIVEVVLVCTSRSAREPIGSQAKYEVYKKP